MHRTGEKFGGMKVKECGVLSGEDNLKFTAMMLQYSERTKKPLNHTLSMGDFLH